MSCHSLLAWRVSIERSAVILMGIPLCVICCFSLAGFNICSLCLVFINLINVCLRMFSSWVYPVWDYLGFLGFGGYFLPHFRENFNYYLLRYFLMPFLFVIFCWGSYDSNVGAFNIVSEVSEVVLICFNSFFFFPLCLIYFHHSFTSLILFSASFILLLVPSRVFFISFIVLFIIDWLFFISYRSLLNFT